MLSDHETRLRRQETLVAIGVTTIVLTVIVVGVVLAILLRGLDG
jgi:NhaP-type Na+/H+ or K+/H+ antiporter